MPKSSERDDMSNKSAIYLKKIKKAFDVFDQQGNETCDAREVGSILRSLNIYPSQEQLANIIKEVRGLM